uniref:Uncharacterized protein n=1 Tax=Anolis carolinensis TaxID=28377 RepID=A0A803TVQ3_ANOCA
MTAPMEKYSVFAVILYAVCLYEVLGYPYNDVSIACDSMLPDRGSGPQRSPPPYVISVSFDRYDPGNEIQGKHDAQFTRLPWLQGPNGFSTMCGESMDLYDEVLIQNS